MNGETASIDFLVTTNPAPSCHSATPTISDLLQTIQISSNRYSPPSTENDAKSRFVLKYGVIPGILAEGLVRLHALEDGDFNDNGVYPNEESDESKRKYAFHRQR